MLCAMSGPGIWVLLVALTSCTFTPPPQSDAGAEVPTVQFGSAITNADERSGALHVTVVVAPPAAEDVTVAYAVTGGTATRDSDYALAGTTLTIPAGAGSADLVIDVVDDLNEAEGAETIELELSAPTGAALGPRRTATVAIANGVLSRVTLPVAASSGSEATPSAIAVALDLPATGVGTVHLRVSGTTTAGEDYSALADTLVTFQPGEQVVEVPIGELDDALDEDDETLVFELGDPSPNLLLGAQVESIRTLTDNDASPSVGFATAATTIAEGGLSTTVEVALSAPSGRAVSVDYTAGGNATSPGDGVVVGAPGTLTFARGETTKTITVAVIDDSLDEADEDFDLALSSPVNASLARANHEVTITDDDSAPQIAFVAATSSVGEANTTVEIAVALSAPSGRTVTAPFALVAGPNPAATDPADYTLAASPLVFDPGVTSRTITVAIKNDAIDEPDEEIRLGLGVVVNATKGALAQHALTITDDGDPASIVQFDPAQSDRLVDEGDAGTTAFTYDLVLDKASGFPVTASIAFTGDADAGDFTSNPPYGAPPLATAVVFAPGETRKTITLSIIGDSFNEPGATDVITMELTSATNATVGAEDERRHTIRDDD
jgi:large repetitive protein